MNRMNWWETIPLNQMTTEQWEQLCDGCGKCCLIKLQDEDDTTVYYTDIACVYLDHDSCRCTAYEDREQLVADCVRLTKDNLEALQWLPPSCAYRMIDEGKKLDNWHPLVCGNSDTMHKKGYSVRGRVIAEDEHLDYEEHIVSWPIKRI